MRRVHLPVLGKRLAQQQHPAFHRAESEHQQHDAGQHLCAEGVKQRLPRAASWSLPAAHLQRQPEIDDLDAGIAACRSVDEAQVSHCGLGAQSLHEIASSEWLEACPAISASCSTSRSPVSTAAVAAQWPVRPLRWRVSGVFASLEIARCRARSARDRRHRSNAGTAPPDHRLSADPVSPSCCCVTRRCCRRDSVSVWLCDKRLLALLAERRPASSPARSGSQVSPAPQPESQAEINDAHMNRLQMAPQRQAPAKLSRYQVHVSHCHALRAMQGRQPAPCRPLFPASFRDGESPWPAKSTTGFRMCTGIFNCCRRLSTTAG